MEIEMFKPTVEDLNYPGKLEAYWSPKEAEAEEKEGKEEGEEAGGGAGPEGEGDEMPVPPGGWVGVGGGVRNLEAQWVGVGGGVGGESASCWLHRWVGVGGGVGSLWRRRRMRIRKKEERRGRGGAARWVGVGGWGWRGDASCWLHQGGSWAGEKSLGGAGSTEEGSFPAP